jgi:hypothetical protein
LVCGSVEKEFVKGVKVAVEDVAPNPRNAVEGGVEEVSGRNVLKNVCNNMVQREERRCWPSIVKRIF